MGRFLALGAAVVSATWRIHSYGLFFAMSFVEKVANTFLRIVLRNVLRREGRAHPHRAARRGCAHVGGRGRRRRDAADGHRARGVVGAAAHGRRDHHGDDGRHTNR